MEGKIVMIIITAMRIGSICRLGHVEKQKKSKTKINS